MAKDNIQSNVGDTVSHVDYPKLKGIIQYEKFIVVNQGKKNAFIKKSYATNFVEEWDKIKKEEAREIDFKRMFERNYGNATHFGISGAGDSRKDSYNFSEHKLKQAKILLTEKNVKSINKRFRPTTESINGFDSWKNNKYFVLVTGYE